MTDYDNEEFVPRLYALGHAPLPKYIQRPMSPEVFEQYQKAFHDQPVREMDNERYQTIFADKVCTDEEMVRLQSHVDAMTKKLEAGGSCGRELDFIAQEMNREANTTLSKANNLQIADTAIALKTAIEKVREQVQNIE